MGKTDSKEATLTIIGEWVVKSGSEDKFISEWTTFARWSNQNVEGSGIAYLFQESHGLKKFYSLWPWQDEDSIEKWKEHPEYEKFYSAIKGLYEETGSDSCKIVSSSIG
jgi:heme-degrading monooxygenase HmoA